MNKTKHYATLFLLLAVSIFTLSSCTTDDMDQAYDLSGYWQGSIYGDYYSNRYNNTSIYDTEIQFVQNGTFSTGGTGVERDYDRYGLVNECGFDWEVRNGRIYMDFYDGYQIIIRDYELYSRGNSQRFRGIFESYRTGEQLATFDLIKTNYWSNWAKTHNMQTLEQDSTQTTVTEKDNKQ